MKALAIILTILLLSAGVSLLFCHFASVFEKREPRPEEKEAGK